MSDVARRPYTLRILLENAERHGETADAEALRRWDPRAEPADEMPRVGRTFQRRIVLNANPRQPALRGRQDIELIDFPIAAVLKQNAIEIVVPHFVSRNVMHIVAERKRCSAA